MSDGVWWKLVPRPSPPPGFWLLAVCKNWRREGQNTMDIISYRALHSCMVGSYITSFAFCFLHLNCRILIKSEYDMLERGRLTRLERLCSIRFTCTTMFTNFAVLWLANTPDKYTSSIHIPLHSILYIKRQIHVCPGRIQANIKLQANPLTSTKIHHYIL